jgi:hypothetical protein
MMVVVHHHNGDQSDAGCVAPEPVQQTLALFT